ncbi:MAG: alpha/beta fold hydrolase [Methylocystis sp.]
MKASGVYELDGGDNAEDEGDPSPPARLIVSILARMDVGRVELKAGRLTVEGIAGATRIDDLKREIEARKPAGVAIAALRIDPPERAPFHWIAEQKGEISLYGDVIDEAARARLVGMARNLAGGEDDGRVVDGMRSRPELPADASGLAEVALAQLHVLSRGFVWIYGRRVDLIGSSSTVGVSEGRRGCLALVSAMPKETECGLVDIEFTHGHQHHHNWGPGGLAGGYLGSAPARPTLPAKPVAYTAQKTEEFTSADLVAKSSDLRVVDILFATLRKLDTDEEEAARGAAAFSGERSDTLNFGRARVRVPEGHKMGRVELPGGFSLFGWQLTQEETDPERHFVLRSVQSLTSDQWDSLIDSIGPHEALVFIHGFNNSFKDAVFRFAQIAFDTQFTGLPVLFSWASRGEVADYEYDRNSALIARTAFLQLLDNLQKKHGISKVHVIAHSMGNFLVLDALANLGGARGAMGELIMAAPDIDRDEFKQDLPRVRGMFSGLTLYASATDRALALSMKVAGGIPRAGYVPPEGPIVLSGLETLDVTVLGDEMFGLNHATFAEARPLIDDIRLILTQRLRAPRLAEERPMPEGASTPKYWRIAP